jgi:ribosomal protein RSM22 (predicted rRNA methylase)
MTSLFPPLPAESRRILDRLPEIIDGVFPMPGRFRAALSRDVAELSRLLTAGREDRSASYLGKPALLQAYLRYFLPWNVYRLCRLFTLLPLDLKPGDAVNDFGAGPLTLTAALWISRPELRKIPLEFRCLDRTAAVLEAGRNFFSALARETAGGTCPWKIKTIRGELRSHSLSVEIRGKPAALSAAVNVYNELFWNIPPRNTEALVSFTERQARLLSSLTDNSGSVLAVEPGIPRSGEFISLLRGCLIAESRCPLSPCVHSGPCALPGNRIAGSSKEKWCHFAFDTEDAPIELHRLSAASKIPKERAVLSFILVGPKTEQIAKKSSGESKRVKVRVISDSFPVKGSWGRYGCSERGPVLVTGGRRRLDSSPSGALEELSLSAVRDEKSGALIAALDTGST